MTGALGPVLNHSQSGERVPTHMCCVCFFSFVHVSNCPANMLHHKHSSFNFALELAQGLAHKYDRCSRLCTRTTGTEIHMTLSNIAIRATATAMSTHFRGS